MPDKRKHRGKHPNDDKNFNDKYQRLLKEAVKDLSFLLSRGYSGNSALKLVGDRYFLNVRQRKALSNSSCSDQSFHLRKKHEADSKAVKGRTLAIDGYNLLITIESALSGAYLFRGRDGAIRDLAGIHGSYRKVEETLQAFLLIKEALEGLKPAGVTWFFDSPVSNSGRLKQLVVELTEKHKLPWHTELVHNADKELEKHEGIIVSSDSVVMERSSKWLNLTDLLLKKISAANLIDLSF